MLILNVYGDRSLRFNNGKNDPVPLNSFPERRENLRQQSTKDSLRSLRAPLRCATRWEREEVFGLRDEYSIYFSKLYSKESEYIYAMISEIIYTE